MKQGMEQRHPRALAAAAIAGFIIMILGAVDPLEGSVVVVAGMSLLAGAAWMQRSRYRTRIAWEWLAVAVGVAAMWIMSAFGGVGGSTGKSIWWTLLILPYPIGWLLGLVDGVRIIRANPSAVRS